MERDRSGTMGATDVGMADGGPVDAGAPDAGASGAPQHDGTAQRRRLRRRALVSLVVAAVVAALVGFVLSSTGHSSTTAVVSGGPGMAGVHAADASLMGLTVVPKGQVSAAPGFQLVDQHGQATSLRQFRGKVVIWALSDDQCQDLCRLFAQDVVTADRDLGRAAKDVVFLTVNANPYYTAPATVLAWSEQNDVERLPNWVYVTGDPAQLQRTWGKYHVTVLTDPQTRTVQHDASLQFIDPSGRLRALGDFSTGAISTAYYGHLMAQVANDLLPSSRQVAVGGPDVEAATTQGASIGDHAPAFTLPTMGTGHQVPLASLAGTPTVLNFWSSTCTICDQEMPALQEVSSAYGGKVRVVGVDVADPRSAAAAFAARTGAHYQLLADHDGTAAAAYRVDALPVTFVLAPDGVIRARHPGALTPPELEAILAMDFPKLPLVTG